MIVYDSQPKEFLRLLADTRTEGLPNPVQFELESRYRRHEHGETFKDLSFFIGHTCVLYHKYNNTTSGFNGSGAEIHGKDDVIDNLCGLALNHGLAEVKVALIDGTALQKAQSKQKFRGLIDLTRTEAELHAGVRKSFKSLINNGRAEMTFKAITKDNADEKAFREFEAFHLHVAGRKTRSAETWNVQLEMIEAGEAELLMGYLEPHGLVSSALFTDYGQTTSYAVAVYNRDLFDKPLAHANVYKGMLRAKSRGQKNFNLGVMPVEGEATEKEMNIGKFKKGFVPSLTPFYEWTIPIYDNQRNKA